uniref:Secreted protein n=1 Tax=Arundo donax TaxID=35708 RepID=A0A0A9CR63_ARUDO
MISGPTAHPSVSSLSLLFLSLSSSHLSLPHALFSLFLSVLPDPLLCSNRAPPLATDRPPILGSLACHLYRAAPPSSQSPLSPFRRLLPTATVAYGSSPALMVVHRRHPRSPP